MLTMSNGLSASFERIGEGLPILGIPGGPGAPAAYVRVFAEGLTDDLTWYLVDPPGTGSTPPADDYGIDATAGFYLDAADSLGLDRFLVFGHSYSGVVATTLAATSHDRLLGAILCEAPVVGVEPDAVEGEPIRRAMDGLFERHSGASWYEEARRHVFDPAPDDDPETIIRSLLMTSLSRSDVELVDRLIGSFSSGLNEAHEAWFYEKEWGPLDLRPVLPTITCPVLSVVGAHDWLVPPEQTRWHARLIPYCTRIEIADCGHFPPLEQSETWRVAVRSWLEEIES